MKLWIIAVGHKMPIWVETAIEDFQKRMPKDCSIDIKELKPDISPSKEAIKIQESIPKNSYVIGMDERGKDITTMAMSQAMDKWRHMGRDITFLIGGADGLDLELKRSTAELWRLSSLTLPHAMARLLLVEQLYRSYTILQNHPYHRE